MSRALLLVMTAPASDQDEGAFNAWYDDVHLSEILATIDGISHASRYHVIDQTTRPAANGAPTPPAWHLPYGAIYEMDVDSAEQVVAEVRAANLSGRFTPTESLDKQVYLPQLFLLKPYDPDNAVRHHD